MATHGTFAPRDGKVWHVDWFGEVEQTATDAEPTVEVFLSEVNEGALRAGSRQFTYDGSRQTVRLGIGRLPAVPLGSLWQNDTRYHAVPYETWAPRGVVFSKEHVTLVRSGVELGPQRFLIPPYVYRLGGGMDTWSAVVKTPEGELVLPCMEVLRYYYGSSTHVVNALVGHSFATAVARLYDRDKSGVHEDGTVVLRLRKKSKDADAARLALLYLSEYAQEAAGEIHESLTTARGRKENLRSTLVTPKVRPPVCGPVKLEVEGVWIERRSPCRFLALRIKRGTLWPAGLEIREIGLERDNDGRSVAGAPPDRRPAWQGSARAIVFESDDEIEPGSAPNSGVETEVCHLEPDDAEYGGLPPIRKLEKADVKYRTGSLRRGVSPLDRLSTGEARGSTGDTRPLEFARGEGPDGAQGSFDFVRSVVARLSVSLPCIATEIRADHDGAPADRFGSPVTPLPRSRGFGPQRCALVTRLEWQGRSFYVLELKGASLVVVYREGGAPLSGSEFKQTLRICADTGTWFGQRHAVLYVAFRRFPHPDNEEMRRTPLATLAQRMAARIAAHLQRTVR